MIENLYFFEILMSESEFEKIHAKVLDKEEEGEKRSEDATCVRNNF